MPKPEPKESLRSYMSRFMGAKKDKKYKPKQRAAIGYSEYRQAHHGHE
jgi:hypothetical protein